MINQQENRWLSEENQLAAQIPIRNLQGWLFKYLIVEPGQKVLFSEQGKSLGVQGEGRYLLQDVGDILMRQLGLQSVDRLKAIVVQVTPFTIDFNLGPFFSNDPFSVGMTLSLLLEIESIEKFVDTFLQRRQIATTATLQRRLDVPLANAIQEWVGSHSLENLVNDFQGQRDLADFCIDRMRQTMQEIGISLKHLHSMNYRVQHRQHLQEQAESYLIKVTTTQAELDGETKLFELLSEKEKLAIQKETAAVLGYEQRTVIRSRMRQAVQSEEFDKLLTEQAKAEFLRSIDRHNLLNEDEWERLKRSLVERNHQETAENQQEQAIADRIRARALTRLEIETEYDLAATRLEAQIKQDPAELAHSQMILRKKLEAEQANITAKQLFELAQEKQKTAFEQTQTRLRLSLQREQNALNGAAKRQEQLLNQQAQRQAALADTKNWAERERIRLEIVKIKSEIGATNLARMHAEKREHEHQSRMNQLLANQRQMEIALQREKAVFEQELAQTAQAHANERAWIDSLRGLTQEELIVAARDEQRAQLLHDLKLTQVMKGLSEEQILAKMAGDSATAAQALAEKYKTQVENQLAAEQKALFEQMMALQSSENQRLQVAQDALRDDHQRERDSMNQLLKTQLDGLANIERAKVSPPPIVTQSFSQTVMNRERRCATCDKLLAQSHKFCPHCGKPVNF